MKNLGRSQPEWKFEFNLGDESPIEYGGLFVYRDVSGAYAPECTKLIPNDLGNSECYEEYRFIMEPLTFESIQREWFYKSLASIARDIDMSENELISALTGNDLGDKARAWESIGEYCGWENLDSYPLIYKGRKGRKEVEERFWFEAGKKHPPAGMKITHIEMSYSIEPDDTCYVPDIASQLAKSVGLQNMKFGHHYGKTWTALLSLGELI